MRSSVFGLLVLGAGLMGCAHRSAPSTDPFAPAPAPSVTTGDPAPLDSARSPLSPPARATHEAHEARQTQWLSATTASDFMLAGHSQQAFGVFIDVPRGVARGHVPTVLTLAIDTSGSMRGDSIRHAREAARRIVDQMEDGDLLSIVTFADRGRVRLAPTVIDAPARRRASAIIEELSANGGTAMHEGLKLAESQMWGSPDTHLVRRMMVISDGKATEGPSSPEALGRVAEVGLQRGIQVTSIGVGLDYDENTLNALAIRSSGRLYHVEHSEQLPEIVEQEVALLESTVAAEVEVELVAAPGVRLVGTDSARNRWSDGTLVVPIGAIFEGQQRELLVRAVVDDAQAGSKVLASVRMHFRDPAEDGVARVQETILRTTVTDDASLVAAHANSRTQTLLAMREASMVARQASMVANDGDLERAEAQLARAEQRLRAQAAATRDAGHRQRVMRSASSMAKTRKRMSKAKRQPAPARASAGRKAALELNDSAMDAMGF